MAGAEAWGGFFAEAMKDVDFVTHRTTGWGFARTGTLAEGQDRYDFRWTKGGDTQKGGPRLFSSRSTAWYFGKEL